jgi:hypothetical protein
MHPLAQDMEGVKDVELESKLNDLTKKYFLTQNVGVKQQISLLIDTYKEELDCRRMAAYNKMMNTRDKDLDKLINIS